MIQKGHHGPAHRAAVRNEQPKPLLGVNTLKNQPLRGKGARNTARSLGSHSVLPLRSYVVFLIRSAAFLNKTEERRGHVSLASCLIISIAQNQAEESKEPRQHSLLSRGGRKSSHEAGRPRGAQGSSPVLRSPAQSQRRPQACRPSRPC